MIYRRDLVDIRVCPRRDLRRRGGEDSTGGDDDADRRVVKDQRA